MGTMTPLVLRFAPGVTLLADGDDAEATIDIAGGGEIKIAELDPGKNAVLRALTEGATEDELLAARGDDGGAEGKAWVHFTVGRMVSIGLVRRTLGDPPLAVVDGIGRGYQPSGRPLPGGPVRVEPFATPGRRAAPRCSNRHGPAAAPSSPTGAGRRSSSPPPPALTRRRASCLPA